MISLDFELEYTAVQFRDGEPICGNWVTNSRRKFAFSKGFLASWIFFYGGVIFKKTSFQYVSSREVSDFWTDKRKSCPGCGFSPIPHFVCSSAAVESLSHQLLAFYVNFFFWRLPYRPFLLFMPRVGAVCSHSPTAGPWLWDVGMAKATLTHLA